MSRKLALFLLTASLLLAACGGAPPDADAISTIVAATLQASQADQEPAPEQPEANAPGSIAGNLSFPSEGIPPLNVVAYQVDGDAWFLVATEQNQTSYQLDGLAPGSYYVVAYDQTSDYGGGYTAAVPCGLSVDCTDHSLIAVEVSAGLVTSGIDPGDWYAAEGAFPPNPDVVVGTGSISGSLSYPSSFIPALNVVAFNTETNSWQMVVTQQNQSSYQIDGLPAGTYFVVAYPIGDAEGGGYSAAVPCGLSVNCTDHSLLPVQVVSGGIAEGVDPGDWYAGPGVFPSSPVP